MWEPGSIRVKYVLGIKRKPPLTGFTLIGFYCSMNELLSAFNKHKVKRGICIDIDKVVNSSNQLIDNILPEEYNVIA